MRLKVLAFISALLFSVAAQAQSPCPPGASTSFWGCFRDPTGAGVAYLTDYIQLWRPTSYVTGTVNGLGPVSLTEVFAAMTASQITTALGYTPIATTGGTFTGPVVFSTNLVANTAATGSTTALALSDRFAEQLNIRDGCGAAGAVGDGVTDDSPAIAACITLANTLSTTGVHKDIYAPAGNYLIKGTQLPVIYLARTSIIGDGKHKTYFTVDPTYSYGAVFAWEESWAAGTYIYPRTTSINTNTDYLGAGLKDLSIFGTNSASTEQDAIVFYDRNDHVLIRDVDVFNMNGQCLQIGVNFFLVAAYMRESEIQDFKCWNSGTSTKAAVEISAQGTGDTTNQLQIYGMNIFGAVGTGMLLHNNNTVVKGVGRLHIFGLRIENSGYDDLDIGAASDTGVVDLIDIFDAALTSPGQTTNGYYALVIGGAPTQSYGNYFEGLTIGPCSGTTLCNGVKIDNARNVHLGLSANSAVGTAGITTTANTGLVSFSEGGADEQYDSYSLNSATAGSLTSYTYKSGNPSGNLATNAPSVIATIHDGSAAFGNAVGFGSVDLQTIRSAATQVPAAVGSVTIGGNGNTVTSAGINAANVAGASNNLSGPYSFSGGGQSGTDRGHANAQVFGGTPFSGVLGSSQLEIIVLGCSAVSPSNTCRLTADHNAATATNCVSVPANTAYSLSMISAVAHDVTSTSLAQWNWMMTNAALGRGSTGVASTAYAAGTVATAVNIGTVTGAAMAASADTTNGCLNLTFTAPSVGTDTWDVTATLRITETQ